MIKREQTSLGLLEIHRYSTNLRISYERVVVRIFENPIETEALAARTILGQVICADRPQKWKEIQSRFCIDVETQTTDPDRIQHKTCKHLCGSLVDIHRDKKDKF